MQNDQVIALARKRAGEPGFFRACLGGDVSDQMASGKMDDDSTLRATIAVAEAVVELSSPAE